VDTSLKQRLVGAALLIALAVIFIPMFFDDASREKPVTLDMDVPPKPKYTSQNQPATPVQVQEPASKGQPATPVQVQEPAAQNPSTPPVQAQEPDSKDAPADEIAMVKPAAKPPIDERQAPDKLAAPGTVLPPKLPGEFSSPRPKLIEWAVQVGSFSERENAATLRDDLRSSGFAAFEEKAVSEGEQVFRVMVGPEKERKRAEALRARLRNQEDLDGIVVSRYPAAPGS
jgi:DedD protein